MPPQISPCGGTADATDLKSVVQKWTCGFDSHRGQYNYLTSNPRIWGQAKLEPCKREAEIYGRYPDATTLNPLVPLEFLALTQ